MHYRKLNMWLNWYDGTLTSWFLLMAMIFHWLICLACINYFHCIALTAVTLTEMIILQFCKAANTYYLELNLYWLFFMDYEFSFWTWKHEESKQFTEASGSIKLSYTMKLLWHDICYWNSFLFFCLTKFLLQ